MNKHLQDHTGPYEMAFTSQYDYRRDQADCECDSYEHDATQCLDAPDVLLCGSMRAREFGIFPTHVEREPDDTPPKQRKEKRK